MERTLYRGASIATEARAGFHGILTSDFCPLTSETPCPSSS
jgi:hypothetical protein